MPPKKSKKVQSNEKSENKEQVEATQLEAQVESAKEEEKVLVLDLKQKVSISETVDSLIELQASFKELIGQLSKHTASSKGILQSVKKLEKRVNKEIKDARKSKKKGGHKQGDKPKRQPSGFAKPAPISDALANFLGRKEGCEMARTEVTKLITTYIHDKKLQNPENKRHILPDEKLGALLCVTDKDQVTYFNLQKYMKLHFPKKVVINP